MDGRALDWSKWPSASPSKSASGMQSHCQNLVDAAEKSAAAYDAMAAIHDEEAKKATK
jgi:hypothetical protein